MALINITPAMISNTEPKPYAISASSEYVSSIGSGTYDAFYAINDSKYWHSVVGEKNAWIMIDFGENTKLSAISMISGSMSGSSYVYYAASFSIVGSYDGNSWVDVYENNSPGFTPNTSKLFEFGTVDYRYYKILLTSSSTAHTMDKLRFYYASSEGSLSIHKTLKDELPQSIDTSKDELHFTEDGGIYISKNDGTFLKCGGDKNDNIEVLNMLSEVDGQLMYNNKQVGSGSTGTTFKNIEW